MDHGLIDAGRVARFRAAQDGPGKQVELVAGDWSERYAVALVGFRDAMPDAEIHDAAADVFHLVDGEAVMILGGSLRDEQAVSPGERKGSGISGGETKQMRQGDTVSIPPGLPHQIDARGRHATFLLVKVSDR